MWKDYRREGANVKMFSCKEMGHISILDEKKDLSLTGKANYYLHLLICVNCRIFVSNVKVLRKSVNSYFQKKMSNVDRAAIKELEQKVIEEFSKKER